MQRALTDATGLRRVAISTETRPTPPATTPPASHALSEAVPREVAVAQAARMGLVTGLRVVVMAVSDKLLSLHSRHKARHNRCRTAPRCSHP